MFIDEFNSKRKQGVLCIMIRLSMGTAIELGILHKKCDISPTTAYVMIGDKCNNNCAFCSQSIESSTKRDRLSRVVWPEYTKKEIEQYVYFQEQFFEYEIEMMISHF